MLNIVTVVVAGSFVVIEFKDKVDALSSCFLSRNQFRNAAVFFTLFKPIKLTFMKQACDFVLVRLTCRPTIDKAMIWHGAMQANVQFRLLVAIPGCFI